MASIGYGQYRYNRGAYNNPVYHFAEAVLTGTAGINASINAVYTLQNETIAGTANLAVSGNYMHQIAANLTANSGSTPDGLRIFLGIPLESVQNSGWLAHGTQVDQAELFAHVVSGVSALANQIDLGQTAINVVSGNVSNGLQIDLGATAISAASSQSSVGTQIDLGIVNKIAVGQVVSVGTQIDLGASSSCVAKTNIGTLSPVFSTFTKLITVENNKFKIDGYTQAIIQAAGSYNYIFDVSDSSNNGSLFKISNFNDGVHTTANTLQYLTDSSSQTFLQYAGASAITTGGGVATNKLQTIYQFSGDTSGQPPTYTGTNWAYVYPTATPIVNSNITATVGSVTKNGYQVLTINGMPCYQYTGDDSWDDASGVITNWAAFEIDGTIQSNTKTGNVSSSLEITSNITRNGTAGQAGANVTYNIPANTEQNYYYYNEQLSGYGSLLSVSNIYSGIETVLLIKAEDQEIVASSALTSSGIRRYFVESNIPAVVDLKGEGVIKWVTQNNPNTTWTEQKIAR